MLNNVSEQIRECLEHAEECAPVKPPLYRTALHYVKIIYDWKSAGFKWHEALGSPTSFGIYELRAQSFALWSRARSGIA